MLSNNPNSLGIAPIALMLDKFRYAEGATKKKKGAVEKKSGDLHKLDNLASSVGILELSGDELNCRATKDLCESLVRFAGF